MNKDEVSNKRYELVFGSEIPLEESALRIITLYLERLDVNMRAKNSDLIVHLSIAELSDLVGFSPEQLTYGGLAEDVFASVVVAPKVNVIVNDETVMSISLIDSLHFGDEVGIHIPVSIPLLKLHSRDKSLLSQLKESFVRKVNFNIS